MKAHLALRFTLFCTVLSLLLAACAPAAAPASTGDATAAQPAAANDLLAILRAAALRIATDPAYPQSELVADATSLPIANALATNMRPQSSQVLTSARGNCQRVRRRTLLCNAGLDAYHQRRLGRTMGHQRRLDGDYTGTYGKAALCATLLHHTGCLFCQQRQQHLQRTSRSQRQKGGGLHWLHL